MKAFVAGATGQTGRRIVKELVNRGIEVRCLVRDVEAAKQILPEAAELVKGDLLEPETLTAAVEGCDVVLSAAGASPSFNPLGPFNVDLVGGKNLTNAAKQAGAKHLVLVSSLCVSKLFHPLNLFFLILVWKRQAEKYIANSGLTYTIVRPGGLRNEDTPGNIVMKGADTLFEGSIPRDRVAKVCVEALSEPAAKNKIVEVVVKEEAPQQPIGELFASVS